MPFRQRFLALDRLLQDHRAYWQLRPFASRHNPWQALNPGLAQWLQGLDEHQLACLESQPDMLSEAIRPWLPEVAHCQRLCELSPLPFPGQLAPAQSHALPDPGVPEAADASHLSYRIPGRKWQQILAFADAVPPAPRPILEWCAGKGHLGRLLGSRDQQPITSLEIDAQLCEEGAELSRRQGIPQTFQMTDVLTLDADSVLASCGQAPMSDHQARSQAQSCDCQAVALHACGDLHRRLLQWSVSRALPALHLSPCCYHRSQDDLYQPLSQLAGASALRLQRQDRQLAVQETVTAGQRVQRLRLREVQWRLGFDLLQRDLRGQDEYLNLPSCQKSLLTGSFADFCAWAAQRKGLSLPATLDFARYEHLGGERFQAVRRLELIMHLFRRPLELWLVLDLVLFLEEQGYQVSLGEFCARWLTPRNLMIQAWRSAQA